MTTFLRSTFAIVGPATVGPTQQPWRSGLAMAGPSTAPFERAQGTIGWRATLAVFIIGAAGLGYAWLAMGGPQDGGSMRASTPPPPPAMATDRTARSDALAQAQVRVAQTVERLAEAQKAHPGDADGWQMLGRSYAAFGQHAKAIHAFRAALRLRPDDATLLAEAAYSAAVIDTQGTSSEPARWITRALQLDPDNRKALALAGTLAVDRKDYAGAVRYWEHLVGVEPPDSKVAREVRVSVAQARQLAASERALTPTAVFAQMPATMAVPRAQVSGTVTLAPALRTRVAPDDTVFVYARPADGPRMPLVMLRKQVRDLPLRFTLDDSLAMSAGATLSNAVSVVVGARITHGGNVLPRAGDLQGQLPAVAVGSADLKIEIDQVVGTH